MTDSPAAAPHSAAGRHGQDAQPEVLTLTEFNRAGPESAGTLLRACLDIPEWAERVATGRPYADLGQLHAAAAAAAAGITWEQVSGALRRHPRIGERAPAAAGTRREAAWSSAEQAGVQQDQADALAAGNRAYEQRFGHLFLICASGLSGRQMVDRLSARLENDEQTERGVVIQELRKIAALRLAKAVAA